MDPLEDLLVLALEAKSKLGRLRTVTFFGMLGGALAGSMLLLFGIMLIVIRGFETLYVAAVIAGGFCCIVAVISFSLEIFFVYFERRIDAIDRFINYNPRPLQPAGDSPEGRILTWLKQTDSKFNNLTTKHPDSLLFGATPKGMTSDYSLDAYFIRKTPMVHWRYHLFIKVFVGHVTISNLRELKSQVERVLRKSKLAPSRVLVVQAVSGDIPDELASWIDRNWILFPIGRSLGKELHAVPIEVLVEAEDGHYDLATLNAGQTTESRKM